MSYDLSAPAALISERMGLHFPEDRWPDLDAGAREGGGRAWASTTSTSFIVHLLAGSFGQREIQALATHLTIGETHFFRTPETFAMLQSRLLPELIAAQQNTTRRLRIWSAGCATGQEPYLARHPGLAPHPQARRLGRHHPRHRHQPRGVRHRASTAEYTQWSFRGTPSWVINGYFTRTRDGRYRLDPAIQGHGDLPLPQPRRGHLPLAWRRHVRLRPDPVPQRHHVLLPRDGRSGWPTGCRDRSGRVGTSW